MALDNFPVACFAPSLTDATLATYRKVIAKIKRPSEVADAADKVLGCVEAWYALPESTRKDGARVDVKHKGKDISVTVIPLESEQVKTLWDSTPWMRELDAMSNAAGTGVFDTLPQGDLLHCLGHLLWHAREITLDREPLTADVLIQK